MMYLPRSQSIIPFATGIFLLLQNAHGETYTDASCQAAVTSMGSCAKRWDSIRTECTKNVTSNTVWPGPCECSYFANDLPCFDQQALCADQVWTQVPQWFRDGVTSCLAKDAKYTIRARLGSWQNPFTVVGLAGNATATRASDQAALTARPAAIPSTLITSTASTTFSIASPTLSPASATTSASSTGGNPNKMSTVASAGIAAGFFVGAVSIVGGIWYSVRVYRAKKRRLAKNEGIGKSVDSSDVRSEYAQAANNHGVTHEMDAARGVELEHRPTAIELEVKKPSLDIIV